MFLDLVKRKIRTLVYKTNSKKSRFLASAKYFFSSNKSYLSYEERLKILVNNLNVKDFKKVFIFVCYSEKLSFSQKEYMKTMKKAEYKVIYVNNSKTNNNDINFLNQICTLAFDRTNIARCIGAYKDIFIYLNEKGFLPKISYLSFANDSVQFIPGKNSVSFVSEILDFEKRNYSALFTHKSFEGGPHYQSFFHILDKRVFLNQEYIDFWKSYKLIDDKNFLIQKGEIELSRRFYNKLDDIKILYSTYSLAKKFDSIKKDNITELNEIDINSLIPSITRTKTFGIKNSALDLITKDKFIINQENEYKFGYLYEIIEHSNSTHSAAFLYPIYLNCPFLKIDLAFQGSYSIGRTCFLYKKCLEYSLPPDNEELIRDMSDEFSRRIFKKGIPYGNYHNESKNEFNQGFVYNNKKT